MKPYSIDFRQKIIEVYEQENIPDGAETISDIPQDIELVNAYIDAEPYMASGAGRFANGSQFDLTLEALCELASGKDQESLYSRSTMGRITLQLNYTVKKNSLCVRKRERSRSKKASRVLVENQKYSS